MKSKKKNRANHVARNVFLLAGCATFPAFAHAGVTLYGLTDAGISYSTNENAAGDGKLQASEGFLTSSRWGLLGSEDLGGGYKTVFALESGFAINTGQLLQGGRLFGRKAYVGLQGEFGALTLGRQFTVIHELMASYDAMGLANSPVVGFQSGNYTGGIRQDNVVKYSGTFGGVTVAAQHALGGVAGSFAKSSSTGASLTYARGPLMVGAGYQIMRDTNAYFGIRVPSSNQKVWSFGGTYRAGPATFYAGYTNSDFTAANYRDQAFSGGIRYAFDAAWSATAMGTYDRLKHNGDSGNHFTSAVMLDYAFSKRTDVYVEADYTTLSGAWRTVAANASFVTPFYGHGERIGTMVGLRHKF